MSRQIAFAFRDNGSALNRVDPITKFVGVVALTFLAFGTYLYWAQVALATIIFGLATLGGRIPPRDIWRATWYFAVACVGFFVIQSVPASTSCGRRGTVAALGASQCDEPPHERALILSALGARAPIASPQADRLLGARPLATPAVLPAPIGLTARNDHRAIDRLSFHPN